YWNLYLTRSRFLQLAKLEWETKRLVEKLDKRANLDAGSEVMVRAEAALGQRSADMVRAKTAIRNAEDRIKSLVNDPSMLSGDQEFVVADAPILEPAQPNLVAAAESALLHRPEIQQSFLQWRAAAIRSGLADNETLPQLDAIAEAAVAGLAPSGNMDDAFGDQFSEGNLSFALGLRYEMADCPRLK
ncbi:MAG: hypothetical protein AAF227_09745, partial [Pseudomonadota bacterium]